MNLWIVIPLGILAVSLLPGYAVWDSWHQRKHVNWEHVYIMEREIYGHTFEHIGAPKPRTTTVGDLCYSTPKACGLYQRVPVPPVHWVPPARWPIESANNIAAAMNYCSRHYGQP